MASPSPGDGPGQCPGGPSPTVGRTPTSARSVSPANGFLPPGSNRLPSQGQQHPLDEVLNKEIDSWRWLHNARTNPGFRVCEDGYDNTSDPAIQMQRNMLQVMKRAYWDACLEKLQGGWEDGSGFAVVFEQVIELMDSAATMFQTAPKEKQDEIFKPMVEHCHRMREQIRAQSYDVTEFTETLKIIVNSLLAQLESPYQHQLTQTKFDESYFTTKLTSIRSKEECATEIVESLKYLFSKIDICKAELKNFRLAMLTPQQKAAKERQQFDKIIATFEGRHPWLMDLALQQLLLAARSEMIPQLSDPGKSPDVGSSPSPNETTEGSSPLATTNSGLCAHLNPTWSKSQIAFFRSEEALFRYLVPLLFELSPLRDNQVPMPFRCQLKALHELQNDLQLTALLGSLGLCVQHQVTQSCIEKPSIAGKLQMVLKKPAAAVAQAKRESENGSSGDIMGVESFFAAVKKLLQTPNLDRKSMLSEVEDSLVQLLLDSTLQRDNLQTEEVREFSDVAGKILEQYSAVTGAGVNSPIHSVLVKRMKAALVPDLTRDTAIGQSGSEQASDPIGMTFTFPELGVNPLTVNAPEESVNQFSPGTTERGAVMATAGIAAAMAASSTLSAAATERGSTGAGVDGPDCFGVNTCFGNNGFRVAPVMPVGRPTYRYEISGEGDSAERAPESSAAIQELRPGWKPGARLAPVFPKAELSPRSIERPRSLSSERPAVQASPRSPGAFPRPQQAASPAGSARSVDCARLLVRANLPERPAVSQQSLGEKPWFLQLVARELYHVEMKLARLVGGHWLVYKTWYENVPEKVLEY